MLGDTRIMPVTQDPCKVYSHGVKCTDPRRVVFSVQIWSNTRITTQARARVVEVLQKVCTQMTCSRENNKYSECDES